MGDRRGSEVKRALAVRGVLACGALEGVVAAGGKLDGAFAELHRLFDGNDLQTGDGGEAGFFVEARRGGLGDHRFGRMNLTLKLDHLTRIFEQWLVEASE